MVSNSLVQAVQALQEEVYRAEVQIFSSREIRETRDSL